VKNFLDNIVIYEAALLVAVVSWMFGGTIGPLMTNVVPWLSIILLQGMICFPQRRSGETTGQARARVWSGLKKDALTYVCIAFAALLVIPFLNTGLCEVCDYPEIISGKSPAPLLPFLPFCVNRAHHLSVFLWFIPMMISVLAVKHAMTGSGKKALLHIILWNGFVLALLGGLQISVGAKTPMWSDIEPARTYFFSVFGYPNMAGCYFMLIFVIGFALWRENLDMLSERMKGDEAAKLKFSRSLFWKKHYLLIPTFVIYFAALNSLSRATIMFITVLTVLFFIHTLVTALHKMEKAKRFKLRVVFSVIFAFFILISMNFMPEKMRSEIDTIDTDEVLVRMTGKSEFHVDIAMKIWKQHPVFGVGGWGYKHFAIPNMTEIQAQKGPTVGGINVHNDFLQFLVEHGLVGAGLIVAMMVMLFLPVASKYIRLLAMSRFLPSKKRPPRPLQIFVMPASAFVIIAGLVCALIHSTGDCPFRSPAILLVFFISLAALDSFMPEVTAEK
jgi:O-antigen ligase